MNRKALILASAGVLSLGLVAATNAGASSQGIARADTHSHSLTEIGFDWRDPLQDGYKPYWRCSECCGSNPASSRFDYKDKTTSVTAESLKIGKLTSADAPSGDGIASPNSSFSNIDQSNVCYVTADSKTAAYFSRSRALDSDGKYAETQFNSDPSSFGFSYSGTDAVTSVTFSCRYKSWNYTPKTATEGGITYSSLCQSTYGSETKSYSLDNKIFNDDAWHTITITAKEVGVDSFASLTDFSFKFADLRGYFMISGLSYGTGTVSNSVTAVSFGSVDTSGGDNAIASCSIDATGVAAYTDESCTSAVSATKLSDITDKKIYVKVPLTFSNIQGTVHQDQDNAIGRLTMNVVINEELRDAVSVKASLRGYKSGTWAYTNLRENFIDSASTSYGADGYTGTYDAAINANAIYALVTLDLSTCDSNFALEHIINCFSIKANWSAYLSSMSDFDSDLSKVAYVRGDGNTWLNDNWSDRSYYQMVPAVDCTDESNTVVWEYKLSGFTKLKVFLGGGFNVSEYVGCRYVEEGGDYEKRDYDASLKSASNTYRVRYYDYGNDGKGKGDNKHSFYVKNA